MYRNKAYPFPEIITNTKWTVQETTELNPTAKTDNLNRQMVVPLDRECEDCGVNHGRMIRRIEMGHVKWSPKTIGKLLRGTRQDCLEILEHVRIVYNLARASEELYLDDPSMCQDQLRSMAYRLLERASIADLIFFYMSTYTKTRHYNQQIDWSYEIKEIFANATYDESPFSDYRKSEIEFAVNMANKFTTEIAYSRGGQWPSYRKVQKLAEKLSHIINEFNDKPDPNMVYPQKGEGTGGNSDCGNNTSSGSECSEDELCQECIDKAEQESGAAIGGGDVDKLERRMRKTLIEDMTYRTSNGMGQWGKMEIVEPPLSVNLQSRLRNTRSYRPMDYGYNPKYINRFCIDKKIFKQKQRVLGGTILIDASGSMQFNGQDILEIMMMLPAVNIAMYNGWGQGGVLRVIAKNGMRVNDEYLEQYSGGGNVIDGPSLRWLAEMPERRIWVSDMKVFGIGANSSGYNLLKECYDLCTQNKIINLKDVNEVKEYALKLNVV